MEKQVRPWDAATGLPMDITMWLVLRRLLLGLGAVLLVGGWGLLRYADARQQAVANGGSDQLTLWTGEKQKVGSWLAAEELPGETLYRSGMIAMGAGAALVVFAFPRGSWQPHRGP